MRTLQILSSEEHRFLILMKYNLLIFYVSTFCVFVLFCFFSGNPCLPRVMELFFYVLDILTCSIFHIRSHLDWFLRMMWAVVKIHCFSKWMFIWPDTSYWKGQLSPLHCYLSGIRWLYVCVCFHPLFSVLLFSWLSLHPVSIYCSSVVIFDIW